MAEIAERAGGNPLFLRSLLGRRAQRPGRHRRARGAAARLRRRSGHQPDRPAAQPRAGAAALRRRAGCDVRRDPAPAHARGEELPTGRATLHRLADFLEPAGHGRFRFRHALIRDAAYEGLSYRRRRDLHGRVGETLEDTAENPEELAELLSLHYFHAGRHDRAWHYSRLAGERARAKYAWVEAAQFFRRAAEVSRRSPNIDVRERAWVLEALGDSQASIGTFSDALNSFQAARRMVGGDRLAVAELLRKEALVNHRMDRVPQALRTVTRGLRMLTGDDLAREQLGSRAQLEVWYAWCRHKQGRYHESLRWADLAMADADAADDRAALAEAYEAAFVAHLHMGRTPPRPYGALALELFRELDDAYRQARSLNHLGFAAAVEGDVAGAAHLYARARDAYTRAGDVVGAGSADYNTGDLLLHQGRLPEAEQVLRRVLLLFQSLGNGEWAEAARRELGMAAVRSGRIDEGLAMLARARAELAELKLAAEVVETDAALVEVELARGQWEQALHDADDALPRAVALGVAVAVRALHRHRGRALLGLGRLVEARQALEQALEACAEEGAWDLGGVLVEMAVVARAQGDPDAEDLERRGRQELARQGYVGD